MPCYVATTMGLLTVLQPLGTFYESVVYIMRFICLDCNET
jgi:hypothetical protein